MTPADPLPVTGDPAALSDHLEDARKSLAIALRQVEVRYVGGVPEDAITAVAAELFDAMLPDLWHWKAARRLPEYGGPGG